jgi:hypothetical protein
MATEEEIDPKSAQKLTELLEDYAEGMKNLADLLKKNSPSKLVIKKRRECEADLKAAEKLVKAL